MNTVVPVKDMDETVTDAVHPSGVVAMRITIDKP
jgi:hypothetical protein